jgi:hypothetical protein
MRRTLALIASLSVLLVVVGTAQAAPSKIPSVLKGSASGETVISAAPPYTPRVERTTWSVKGFKLKLILYGIASNNERDRRAVYKITAGTLTLSQTGSGQCSYSLTQSGKLLDLVSGKPSDAIFGFSRASGKSTLDTHVSLAGKTGVQMSCNYYPGEPPVAIVEEAVLPKLLQIVPFHTTLKLSKRMKLHYTHQSTNQGTSLSLDWNLNLKGSKFTKKQRG